jgi:nicotinate-nucleotide adenylyltransferase
MIGILGGTFDPVHYGHLRPALEMLHELRLDHIRFIPCGMPPHRREPMANAEQRLAMLTAAVGDQPGFRIDTRELRHAGPSYTFNTLTTLRKELAEMPLCLIIGMDAFHSLDTWYRWEELITLAHVVVMRRPGAAPPSAGPVASLLERCGITDPAALADSPAGQVLVRTVTQMDIAATDIRERLAHGGNIRYLLPDAVIDIIREQGLYRLH